MDFLKNEIASKKRQLDQVTASLSPSPSPDAPPPTKYLKRAQLERIEQEQREQERKQKEQERREKLYGTKTATSTTKKSAAKSSTDAASLATPDGATRISTTGAGGEQASTPIDGGDGGGGGPTPGETFFVSNEEAIRRLRQKGQPIRLFAESDKDRRLRLRALELIEDRTTDGQRNEFAKAMEGQELGLELDKVAKRQAAGSGGEGKGKGKGKGKGSAVGTPDPDPAAGTAATDKDKDKGKGKGKSADDDDDAREPNPKDQDVLVDLDLVRTNPHKVYPQIYHAFKRVLKEWEQSLADRPESVKRSTQGKMAAATHATSAEYLKPLFKSLRKRELEPDVLMNIAKIAHYMQVREYLKANDAYLQLSIGNAPWPIGVTMVGIHERSGREKIFSNNVAHVLNDETSRKYIQSLKRLLTFAQAVRPPDDVSQKMG